MKIIAFERNKDKQGTGASRRLRRTGQTPGIVYGGTEPPIAITLDHNALYHAFKKEAFHSAIHDLDIEGQPPQKVLLRDFQMHAHKQIVLHADFQRVDANKAIHVKVPLRFVNAEISPAVKLASAMISHVMNDLEISCLPKDLPESIEVDLAHLEVGHSIHTQSIVLPTGVMLVGQDNATVVTAMAPTVNKLDEPTTETKEAVVKTEAKKGADEKK